MHARKLPGKTLAESLGLTIPDDAPGGQPLASPVLIPAASGASKPQNVTNLDYDGFHDTDAYAGAHPRGSAA
jgi:hypothetical protein